MKVELLIQRGTFSSWVCGDQFNGALYIKGRKAIRFSFPGVAYDDEARMVSRLMSASLREHYKKVRPDAIVSGKNSNCDKSLYGTRLIGSENPEFDGHYFFLIKSDLTEKEIEMLEERHEACLTSLVPIRNKMRSLNVRKMLDPSD